MYMKMKLMLDEKDSSKGQQIKHPYKKESVQAYKTYKIGPMYSIIHILKIIIFIILIFILLGLNFCQEHSRIIA
jgi:hypothetical protein